MLVQLLMHWRGREVAKSIKLVDSVIKISLYIQEFLYYDQRNRQRLGKNVQQLKKISFIKNIKDLINVSHCHCVCTISLYSIRSEKNYSVTKKKFLFCEHLPPTEDAERSPMCVHQLVRDYLYDDLWFLV